MGLISIPGLDADRTVHVRKADPAVRVIEDLRRQYPNRKSRLVVASNAPGRSEKINNLLRALQSMDEPLGSTREAILFVDSDARVREDWLRSLVAPLAGASVGAATGYRWYLPAREGFWAAMLSAWNGSIATTLGDHRRNFAWGGSTAIMRDTFDRLDVRAAWEGAVSDDYALTRSVERAGLGIEFVPRCLVVSREQVSLGGLLEFTTRQIIITRVYRPEAWWLGIVTYTLFVLTFFGAIAAVAAIALTGSSSKIRYVPYSEAYGEGFEDMRRRVPSLEKAKRLIGYKPTRTLDDIINDVARDLGQAADATTA